jgi:hypothetical protein
MRFAEVTPNAYRSSPRLQQRSVLPVSLTRFTDVPECLPVESPSTTAERTPGIVNAPRRGNSECLPVESPSATAERTPGFVNALRRDVPKSLPVESTSATTERSPEGAANSGRCPDPIAPQMVPPLCPAFLFSIAEVSPIACRMNSRRQRRSVHPREQPTPFVVQPFPA